MSTKKVAVDVLKIGLVARLPAQEAIHVVHGNVNRATVHSRCVLELKQD